MKHLTVLIIILTWCQITATANDIPRPEYPRPQFERAEWINLNGRWTCQFDFGNSGIEQDFHMSQGFTKEILVPFAPESELSGVEYKDFINYMWYHRVLEIPETWQNQRIQLNFGAVDYSCAVYIDGELVGRHYGGTSSFSFNIAPFVEAGKSHHLVVHVEDNTRSGLQGLGKQSREYQPRRTRYTRTTGIWQTVWMEPVAEYGLKSCHIIPDIDQKKIDFIPQFFKTGSGQKLIVSILESGRQIEKKTFDANGGKVCSVPLKKIRTWSPEDPYLYDILFEIIDADGTVTDRINSYTGLRKIHIEGDRIFLNNKPFYQRLVLDQGFYPDGIWTAPDDAALKRDIELSLAAGFNGARLHQKVFEERYHYWADRLGYITWGESSSWGMDANNPVAARNFISEWTEIIERDRNHPSIIIWTPFNESIFTLDEAVRFKPELRKEHDRFIADVYDITKRIDPTRPVNDVSGFLHIKTDIWAGHCYEQDPTELRKKLTSIVDGKPYTNHREHCYPYEGEPYILSEFGGIKWNPEQQAENTRESWGYGSPPRTLEEYYKRLADHVAIVLSLEHCVGYCYTQLTDVETEKNGIYNYDRSLKFDMEKIKQIFQNDPEWFSGKK